MMLFHLFLAGLMVCGYQMAGTCLWHRVGAVVLGLANLGMAYHYFVK